MRYLFFSILAVSLVGILLMPTASSQQASIPDWVKNNAMWWASDQIPDSAFLQGIKFLIQEGIMVIPHTETTESSQSQEVPIWVKNTAGWWADDKISETEFVSAIEYLITYGIIIINDSSSCVNDLSEIFDDSTTIHNICDLHESSEYSELVPFTDEYDLNSLGFRGTEFSEIKPDDTYRIFMVGGSTMFGAGDSSDVTTIPGILQKIFDSNNSLQNIEVINAGFSGGNSESELKLIKQKLVTLSPDLIIVYDGWNDLRADHPVNKIKYNWKGICKLGEIHNFDTIITLQPIAGFGNKKLTQQEIVNSFTGVDHNGFQLIPTKSTYDYMARELLSLQDHCNVIDLRGIFDDVSGPIYWDQGHVSDTANLILAEKFHGITNEIIFNKKTDDSKFHDVISKYNSPIITSYLLSKIGIEVDYTKIKKQDITTQDKEDGNYFYLKNKLGGSENILVGKDLSKTDLSKINLTGQDLSGANLSGTADNLKDLQKIDLSGTILTSANLSFTNLSGQDLSGKDLTGVNFRNATLENVNLSNIITARPVQPWTAPGEECVYDVQDYFKGLRDLASSHKCTKTVFQNESIRTSFKDANLSGSTINNVQMHYTDFSGADLIEIEVENTAFRNCQFIGTKINYSEMKVTTFFYNDFTNAELENSQFTGIPFFQDVSFHNAKIINVFFEKPIFIDVDFTNANLKDSTINEELIIGDVSLTCQNHQLCD